MGIYCVLHLGWMPEEAYAPLRPLEPFTGFRDASCGVPSYQLPVHQVIAGMWRAKQVGAGWLLEAWRAGSGEGGLPLRRSGSSTGSRRGSSDSSRQLAACWPAPQPLPHLHPSPTPAARWASSSGTQARCLTWRSTSTMSRWRTATSTGSCPESSWPSQGPPPSPSTLAAGARTVSAGAVLVGGGGGRAGPPARMRARGRFQPLTSPHPPSPFSA